MKFLINKLNAYLYESPITVREANKYLDRVVENLKLKHEKVTHEDFDNDLEAITGIRWKQVKNYKNHPSPSQEIQDNSKVKLFIQDQRRRDRTHLIKRSLLLLVVVILFLILCIWALTWKPAPITMNIQINKAEVVTGKIVSELNVPGIDVVFKLGDNINSFKDLNCSPIEVTNSLCNISLKDDPKGSLSLFFYGPILSRITLMTFNQDYYENSLKSLGIPLEKFESIKSPYTDSLETLSYQKGSEKIILSKSSPKISSVNDSRVFIIEIALTNSSYNLDKMNNSAH